jgi:glycosyltransferase involved in cell wall biosynthesis
MRVIFMTAPAEVGGLERVVEMLAAGLVACGHDVLVAAVTASPDGAAEFIHGLAALGVRAERIEVPQREYLKEVKGIRECVAGFGPAVMHTHGYRADVIAGGVARRAGLPVVSTAHGYSGEGLRNLLYQKLQERALRRFDAVVAVSAPIRARLERAGVPRERLRLIQNAFRPGALALTRSDARQALGIDESEFVVGWVGRLEREKGPDVMLRAALPLAQDGISVSFIGDGAMMGGLTRASLGAGVERVRFHGRVSDAARLLSAFDVFALTSRTEGTPIAVLEAMAAGTPIVATCVGGIPDMLSSDEAVLVEPEDEAAIARAVRALRANTQLALTVAERAGQRLRRQFDPVKWVQDYVAVYDEVTAQELNS